jgi:hypothetical protein
VVQGVPTLLVGEGPADAFAVKHAAPAGPPPVPLPSAPFADKLSEADDAWSPHIVPRLASVGTPGEASAVEHVEARVGSCADPIPAADPPNAPVTSARRFARTRESELETFVWLVSAFAVGPDGVGADPSAAEGSGWVVAVVTGAVAVVPGPCADVELCEGPLCAVVFELDPVIGWLVANVAGPALPPFAAADPPAVEPFASGRTSGCAARPGPSARAVFPRAPRSARIATISSRSCLIV